MSDEVSDIQPDESVPATKPGEPATDAAEAAGVTATETGETAESASVVPDGTVESAGSSEVNATDAADAAESADSGDEPGDVTEDVPGDVTEDAPGDVAEDVPGDATEDVPGDVAGDVAEDVPGDVIDQAAEPAAEAEAAEPPQAAADGDEASGAAEPAPPEEPMRVGMASAELKAVVEALIFASPDPITPKTLYKLLADETKEDVSAAVNDLRADYLNRPGLTLLEIAGGYQIVTRPELHEWVRRLFHERSTQKLSVAALESLAVISYKQPVTALEVTEIRGVNASGVLSTLLERNLIKIVGRKNVVGRPFMYGTTKEFLIRFGLKDLGDLPRIEDMAEALGFDPPAGLIEQTPREDVLPLEEPEAAAVSPQDDPPEPAAS
jgi:segregation and condensation protein B